MHSRAGTANMLSRAFLWPVRPDLASEVAASAATSLVKVLDRCRAFQRLARIWARHHFPWSWKTFLSMLRVLSRASAAACFRTPSGVEAFPFNPPAHSGIRFDDPEPLQVR